MKQTLNFESDFSYNKAIRFKLEYQKGKLPEIKEGNANIKKLIELRKNLSKSFKELIYINKNGIFKKDRHQNRILNRFVTIKKQWLKQYFKNDFYADANKIQDFSITNFSYLKKPFEDWFKNWKESFDELKLYIEQNNYEKARRSEIANILSKINSKYYFMFVKDFSKNVNHKDSQTKITELQEGVDNFEKEILLCTQEYLPSQTAGLIVARGSMNYFTVNKKPKNYKEILDGLNKQLEPKDKEYIAIKLYKATQKSKLYDLINQGLDKEQILNELKKDDNVKISFVYDKGIVEQIFKRDLFNEACLEEVISLTKKIKKLNNLKDDNNNLSKETKDKISNLKIERGFYFIKKARGKKHNLYFKSYYNFCESFRSVAQKRGRIIAQINAIEKERIESQQLQYWSLILDDGKEKYLWMIPKEKMQDFRKKIFAKKLSNDGINQLYVFHSLTMRALHKLCFTEESSFVKAMPESLKNMQGKVMKASNDPDVNFKKKKQNERFGKKDIIKTKDELKLSFLKELIKSDYANKILSLDHFKLDKLQSANTLTEFEEYLEKACYYIEKITISNEDVDCLINDFDILTFKITSYDLEDRNKNTYQTKESDYKRHTREIWNKFWNDKDNDIRLNPEVKIRFRKKNKKIEEYLRDKSFDLSKIKNRFLQKQYTANFTFTLNAGKRYPELAFAKTEDVCEEIDKFNEKLNQQYWNNSYKFGIDRGNIELATLCISKFNENDVYEYKGKKFLKPTFPNGEEDIKTYELKREWYNKKSISNIETKPIDERKEKRVIANISYFIDKIENENWFTKKTCTCIDLTTAKVIKDKLILNGDILTFLKLKKEATKRILFELVAQGIITFENKDLKWASNNPDSRESIQLRTSPYTSNDTIYFFEGKFERNFEGLMIKEGIKYSKENVINNFQNYLDNLIKEKIKNSNEIDKHVPPISKINHLRDAIVANMIGVLSFLQNKYPGYVILEDLNHDTLMKHFKDLYINISTRFESALINKFQTKGIIPPHIKDLLEIRELARKKYKLKSSQLGALVFVDESGTSKECPYCGKSWKWDNEEDLKFKEHRYICGKENSCGFDTNKIINEFEFLSEINDPDKIAAYNVSKKIKKYDDIGKFMINNTNGRKH